MATVMIRITQKISQPMQILVLERILPSSCYFIKKFLCEIVNRACIGINFYLQFIADSLYLGLCAVDMILCCDVFRNMDGRGVDHRHQFYYFSRSQETKRISRSLICLEREPCCHVILAIQKHTLIVLIQYYTYLLTFSILGRCVNIVLLPIIMKLELDLFGK